MVYLSLPNSVKHLDGISMHIRQFNYISALFLFIFLFSPGAFAGQSDTKQTTEAKDVSYILGAGDLIKVEIYNQADLSGEYNISGSGVLSMPLIGLITVKGLTINQLENLIVKKLSPDYLLNPRVSIQVMNYRPFYILGEVAEPMSYPYVDGMTYLNAVAIAGGYTYRAKKGYVYVIRGNDTERKEHQFSMNQKVMPGDMIRVDERFF
ncbi:MAG: polysaccharide export protein [Gammaproteobacteria bacterium]|nr:MAG: polysaccharide export protein [Gammaproteobacteria bacterium]